MGILGRKKKNCGGHVSSSFKINLIIECTALTVDAWVYLLFIKSGVEQSTRKQTHGHGDGDGHQRQ